MKTIIDLEGFRLVCFDSKKPGLTICISGGVHGDETCGIKAINKLEKELSIHNKLLSGKLLTLIANQEAVAQKKRFIDFDLNRSFRNHNAIGYESNLAKKITPYLKGVDYLLDLHSTSAPTRPFCAGMLTHRHLQLFKIIGVQVYTHGWEIHRGYSMLIDEVNRLGGVGIVVECGKTNIRQTDKIASKTILAFLQGLKMFSTIDLDSTFKSYTTIKIKQIVKAKSNNFIFIRNFNNLDLVNANEIIAYDNKEPIYYSYPFLIVMPTKTKISAGDEAFGIGIEESQTKKTDLT